MKIDECVPQEVSDAQLVFPAGVLDLMIPYDDLPEEYRANSLFNMRWDKKSKGIAKFNDLFGEMFYKGVKAETFKLYPKEGIDPEKAWRHIRAIMGSFEPKHEHKTGCCVYLMNLWFEDAEWEPMEKNDE